MFLIFLLLASTNALLLDSNNYGGNINLNLQRKNYFNNKKNNILPISKSNTKLVCEGWRFYNQHYYNDISKFTNSICQDCILTYKWVPTNDKNFIKCLISAKLDIKNKILFINNYLENPKCKKSFNIENLEIDINNLPYNFKEFENYNVIYQIK